HPARAVRPGRRGRIRRRARDHDAVHRARPPRARRRLRAHLDLDGAHDAVRRRAVRPLPARADAHLPRRTRLPLGRARPLAGGARTVSKPKLSVWKFSSCDGCQLSLLDCEEELLDVAGAVEIAYFLEASSATAKGPYDLTLVEGSITTPHDAERIHEIRRSSKVLVSIGACATTGGIQALRKFAHVGAFVSAAYARPDYISTLRTSTAIADDVPVDFELQGCALNKTQLLEVV